MTVYVVAIREKIIDAEEFNTYKQLAGEAAKGHPRTPLAFNGRLDVLEGPSFDGAAIMQFPSAAAARAWYDSPAYEAARQHRFKGAEYRLFIVAGVDEAT
jgi:uncharacterized protein (DUF1330 family)